MKYSPRPKPLAIPVPNWNEEPLNCVSVNSEWVGHILGVLNVLDQQDAWLGTSDEIYAARQQVNEIMDAFMEHCPNTIYERYTTEEPESGNEHDDGAVELGLKFEMQTYGEILGIEFWKRPENTGTHFGHLWDSAGTLIATVEFTDESDSGWQYQAFEEPVQVLGCELMTVSVHMPSGLYSYSRPVFDSEQVDSPFIFPLDAGVYGYGSSPTYPHDSFEHSDYFIDIAFRPLLYAS